MFLTRAHASYTQAMIDPIDSALKASEPSLHADVRRVFALSPFFTLLMRTASESECKALFVNMEQALLPDGGEAWVPACDSNERGACMSHLRRCKQRAHRHLIWWEIGLGRDMDRSCQAIADLASGLLDEALSMALRLIAPRFGKLEGGSFCVIGLGKLGGRELNLGSDVDPLFIWQGVGHSSGGRQSIPAAEFYMQLSRMLIRLMAERTADGMVWPVDMRLRPGGDAAAITLNLETSLSHYLEYGQTWERAMLIKARPVAGDHHLGLDFIAGIAPFIYKRYLDFTTVSALAEMKQRIDIQAGSSGIQAGFDVKRGRGGIREIEFIIQSLQLLHGGRNPALRLQPSMLALDELLQASAIAAHDVHALKSAYRFWRRIEHAIQARRGEQTHKLPGDFAIYLAAATGIDHIEQQMIHQAGIVESAFNKFVQSQPRNAPVLTSSWLLGQHDAELSGLNKTDTERMQQALQKIDTCLLRGLLPERSRKQVEIILTQAMPRWLDDANGITALEALAELIRSISGRATWIDLLATHQGALDWLIGVLSASRYLADHIVRDPSWLEWPLMTEHSATDIKKLCNELDDLHAFDDVEQTLADIGRCVDRARLLSALSIDAHSVDAMTIGGWLADIADAATSAVLRLCLFEMNLAHDFPFVALAMGKHGSREMGLVSDLDMVFVLAHDHPSQPCGSRSFGEQAQRLGRRMIQYLSGKPPFGAGFEFDARLRPSGCSGVLVTSIAAFHEYQLHEAQSWEHQALCRARPAAGSKVAQQKVSVIVDDVLDQVRNKPTLVADIIVMRDKMLDHLSSKSDAIINLKHDAGGLVDIEFLAQYARLAFAGKQRRCVDIFLHLPQQCPDIWLQHASKLAETYLDYRQMENALRVELWDSIGKLPNNPEAPAWETMARHAGITSPQALKQRMLEIRSIFHVLLDSEASTTLFSAR